MEKDESEKNKTNNNEYKETLCDTNILKTKDRIENLLSEKQKQDNLNKNIESLSILIRWIAHDFSNLLTPIKWYLELVKFSGNTQKINDEFINIALKSVDKTEELINRLAELSSSNNSIKTSIELYNFVIIAFSSLDSIVASAHNINNIKKIIDFSRNDFFVNWNFWELSKVIINIFNNSVFAIEKKWLINWWIIKVSSSKYICDSNDIIWNKWNNYIHISIEDNWVGISEDNLNKILDPNFTTKKIDWQKNRGLWLIIAYKIIVIDHKWYINIESQEWKWTIVHIYLPEA